MLSCFGKSPTVVTGYPVNEHMPLPSAPPFPHISEQAGPSAQARPLPPDVVHALADAKTFKSLVPLLEGKKALLQLPEYQQAAVIKDYAKDDRVYCSLMEQIVQLSPAGRKAALDKLGKTKEQGVNALAILGKHIVQLAPAERSAVLNRITKLPKKTPDGYHDNYPSGVRSDFVLPAYLPHVARLTPSEQSRLIDGAKSSVSQIILREAFYDFTHENQIRLQTLELRAPNRHAA